jgi:hypothetical protein
MQTVPRTLASQWTNVSLEDVESAAPPVQHVEQSPHEESSSLETFGVESLPLIGVNSATEDALFFSECQSNSSTRLGWDSLPFSSCGSWNTLFDEKNSNEDLKMRSKRKQETVQRESLASNLEPSSEDRRRDVAATLRHPHNLITKRPPTENPGVTVSMHELLAARISGTDWKWIKMKDTQQIDHPFDSIPEDAKKRYCDYLFDTQTCPHPEFRDVIVRIHQIRQDRGEEREWTTQENQLMQSIRYTALFLSRCNHAAARMASRAALDSLLDALQGITENTNRNIIPYPRNGTRVLECVERFPPEDAHNYDRIYFYSWKCMACEMDYFQYYSQRLPTSCPTPGCSTYPSPESIRVLFHQFVENPCSLEEDSDSVV